MTKGGKKKSKGGKKKSKGVPQSQASSNRDPGEKQEAPERSTGPAASEKPANTEPLNSSHSLMDKSDGRRENVEDEEIGESSGQSGGGGGTSAAGDEQSAPSTEPTDSSHNSDEGPWITAGRKKKSKSSGHPLGLGGLSIVSGAGSNSGGGSGSDRPVQLYCNHFEVDFNPTNKIIYQYNVQFKQRKPTKPDQPVAESSNARNNTDEVGKHLKGLKRRILKTIWDTFEDFIMSEKPFAYDGGSILYSIGEKIPQKDYEDVNLATTNEPITRSSESKFDVTIDGEKVLDPGSFPTGMTIDGLLQEEPILMLLSILLHNCSAKADRLRVRQNYYSADEELRVKYRYKGEDKFLTVWKGFHSSFRLSYERADSAKPRLMLNFNDTMTCVLNPSKEIRTTELHIIEFLKGQLDNFSEDDLRDNFSKYHLRDRESQRQKITAVLSGVRVKHEGRTYTIRELHSLDSTETIFKFKPDPKKGKDPEKGKGPEKEEDHEKEKEISVQRYFEKKYKQLRHPRFPLLRMHSRKDVYIPLEVCEIVPGQRYTRLTAQQRTEVLRLSQSNPKDRKSKIENMLSHTSTEEYNKDEALQKIGIQIRTVQKIGIQNRTVEMFPVKNSRIVPAPKLEFGGDAGSKFSPKQDAIEAREWDFRSKKVKRELVHAAWAIYVFLDGWHGWQADKTKQDRLIESDYNGKVATVIHKFLSNLSSSKIWVEEERYAAENEDRRIRHMLNTVKSFNPDLILAVLPKKSSTLYAPLKRICETDGDGLITQCILRANQINKGYSDQYLKNVALKINLKMGGENWNVDMSKHFKTKEELTCIFGLDVSHGSATDPNKPSIAAVVASVEKKKWSRYAPEVRAQQAGEEMINDLEDMVRKLLTEFKHHHGGAPQQIIIYRDGVSESQFNTVKTEELQKFKKACVRAFDREIKITLIVVQKRHHTRFIAEPIANEGKNMDPGTVVSSDSGVCQTTNKDFYLCSHKCSILNATSRPAHYTVLHDEIGFNLPEIEDLTNSLCYCFGRATKAVSIPAPVYYAHVAAEHYRSLWIRGNPGGESFEAKEVGINLRDEMKPYRMFYV